MCYKQKAASSLETFPTQQNGTYFVIWIPKWLPKISNLLLFWDRFLNFFLNLIVEALAENFSVNFCDRSHAILSYLKRIERSSWAPFNKSSKSIKQQSSIAPSCLFFEVTFFESFEHTSTTSLVVSHFSETNVWNSFSGWYLVRNLGLSSESNLPS